MWQHLCNSMVSHGYVHNWYIFDLFCYIRDYRFFVQHSFWPDKCRNLVLCHPRLGECVATSLLTFISEPAWRLAETLTNTNDDVTFIFSSSALFVSCARHAADDREKDEILITDYIHPTNEVGEAKHYTYIFLGACIQTLAALQILLPFKI